MHPNLQKAIKKAYFFYFKKYFISKSIYIVTNIVIMLVAIIITILNAKAIQENSKNPIR